MDKDGLQYKIFKNALYIILIISLVFLTKTIITNNAENNNFDIENGINNQFYYEELFDPIYYSYNYENYKNIYSQPNLKKYNDCAEYELDLYPDNFLNALEKSQKAHNIYFKNPSHDNMHYMVEAQYDTAFAYIEDNKRFIQSLLDIEEDVNFVMSNDEIITVSKLREYLQKNIDNGYAMIEKINKRSQSNGHSIYTEYNLEQYPNPELSKTDNIDLTNIITDDEALKLFKLYVKNSKDDISTQKKLDSYNVEDIFLTKIPLKCYDEYTEVYGVDDDIYAHMFYANIYGKTGIVEQYKYNEVWDMPFAGCNCPFIEEDRINWYLMKYIKDKILTNKYLGDSRIEKKFINSPTYTNSKIVSDYYEKELKIAFLKNNITNKHNEMWRLYNQINTKYFLYDEAANDINHKESLKYFEGPSDNVCEEYQNYVFVESMFHLNFMRWSESVFILNNDIELDKYEDRQYTINITDEKKFLYEVLENE